MRLHYFSSARNSWLSCIAFFIEIWVEPKNTLKVSINRMSSVCVLSNMNQFMCVQLVFDLAVS
jgi:hypothetical protein